MTEAAAEPFQETICNKAFKIFLHKYVRNQKGSWMGRVHSKFSRSYNNFSSGANLTPYSGGIFWGVILIPKRSLKNSFLRVKVTPDIEELK